MNKATEVKAALIAFMLIRLTHTNLRASVSSLNDPAL